jgi:hypothetical protein
METRAIEKYLEYTKIRSKVKYITRNAVKRQEKSIADTITENPKKFWGYVKSKTTVRDRIPELHNPDNNTSTSDNFEKAEILSKFFCSVFTYKPDNTIPDPPGQPYQTELHETTVTEELVEKLLKKIKPGKAMGPDGIHPRVLRETATTIKVPLNIIFKASLQSGEVPSQWRSAYISPIFKKGVKTSPKNYRPVSLTCIPCKILESVIRKSIIEHMKENNLFNKCQYGFMEHRSTTLQLSTRWKIGFAGLIRARLLTLDIST